MNPDIHESLAVVQKQIEFWRDATQSRVPHGSRNDPKNEIKWKQWELVRSLLYELDQARDAIQKESQNR